MDGMNLINWCAFGNHGEQLLKAVQALIDLGVDVNHVATLYGSPLHMLTQERDEHRDPLLEGLLLRHGAVLIPPKRISSALE